MLVLFLGEFLFMTLSTYFMTFNTLIGVCGKGVYLVTGLGFTFSLFNFTFFFNLFILGLWLVLFLYIFNIVKIYNTLFEYALYFILFILVYYLYLFIIILVLLIL